MSEGGGRRFSREFKLSAIARMVAGENVSALSRELGIARKCLYQWRDRYRLGGAAALRSRGRMTKAERWRWVRVSREAGRKRRAGAEVAGRVERGAAADSRAGTQGRAAGARSRFFSASLAAHRGGTPAERRQWRDGVTENGREKPPVI